MADRPLAVITGASSGIGAAFARKVAARGYDLVLVARREDRLRSLAAEFSEIYHVTAEPLAADLVRESDLERVAIRIQQAERLELLVNNAGFGVFAYFAETDVHGQERMHRLHVLATMRLTHAALQNMVPRATGGIINVSSVAAFGQSPQNVSYCSTKAWINSFTQGLAIELGASGSPVRMQALCPGFTLSEFHDVVGMDRSVIPKSLWMTADFVVEASLQGLERRDVFVIPGWRYKLLVAMMKTIPDSLMRWGSVAASRRRRRNAALTRGA